MSSKSMIILYLVAQKIQNPFFEIGEVKFGYYEKGSKFDATESTTFQILCHFHDI